MQLFGRFGSYTPRTPAEKKRARELAAKRRLLQAQIADFLDKHKECKNGCGQPPAWHDGGQSLRYGGCCSEQCLAEWRDKQDRALKVHTGSEGK